MTKAATGRDRRRALRAAVVVGGLSATAGCDAVYELFYDQYHGPLPEKQALVDEPVIARSVLRGEVASPEVAVIYGDRLKYLRNNDPGNINRIVYLEFRTVQPRLDTTQIRAGDTLYVSTRYDQLIYLEGPRREFPNWPYPKGGERYPIGRHTVTRYRR